ncbi:MAG: hypothetical protein JOZ15_14925 [Acidobacteria bacterium]|nr:hypothetical protein [Acidobacteriota bacterium]
MSDDAEGPDSDGGGGGEPAMAEAERRRLLARLAAPPGLCAACVHLRLVASPRSVFVRCGLAATDPAFPRYPPLPVVRCAGYQPLPQAVAGSWSGADGAKGSGD